MTLRKSTAIAAAWIVLGLMLAASLPAPAQAGLQPTPEEAKWLSFMREEEKLAHDVYQLLYSKWNLRIFDNIARSESRHFASLGALLARYGVADPARDLPPGVYANNELMALYQQLASKGGASLQDALEVGLLIEKHDIADLESALKATDRSDIKMVYTNLLTGSLNHLESFEHVLEAVCATQ